MTLARELQAGVGRGLPAGELDVLARELLDRMRAEERDANDDGLCACLCGKVLPSRKRGKRYLDDRHRDARYRARVQALAELKGVHARESLKTLQATNDTRERRPDAPAARNRPQRPRKPRPGVTLYVPTLERAELLLELLRMPSPSIDVVELRESVERAIDRRRRRDTPKAPTTPGGQ